jgi:hypothetical protein
MAFHELSLEKVLNSALIIDEQHILLPYGTLNTFYEFKTVSACFTTINSILIGLGKQECVHKVMLCTFKWLQKYYIIPFFREQQSNPILAAILNPALSREIQPAIAAQLTVTTATAGSQHQQQENQQTRPDQQQPSQEEQQQQQYQQSQQQLTQRSRPPEAMHVQAITERGAIVPDVPVAIAVPVDDDSQSINTSLVEASAAIIL